jgi:metal-responsive CopG/Arc/MetJ family transcriptional regulator
MRIRTSLIIEESLLAQIDEIAGEKQKRAAIIETALREFIDRKAKKAQSKPATPVTARSKARVAAKL